MKTRKTTYLPDGIMVQVLSRLPAYNVRRFRRLSKNWKALISSQYFGEVQLKNSKYGPMILAAATTGELLLIESPQEGKRTPTVRLSSIPEYGHPYSLKFSYNGLIILARNEYIRSFKDYIIFNPVTGEKASIVSRIPGPEKGDIYGMFFHPEIKEYCIIWGLNENRRQGLLIKMFSLESQQYCRDLEPPSYPINDLNIFHDPPVVIDDDATLYWIVRFPSIEEPILVFDIKTEEFNKMPHPGGQIMIPNDYDNMNILKMDGRLSLVHSTNDITSVNINIWSLQDSVTRLWIMSHSIRTDELVRGLNLNDDYHPHDVMRALRAMAVGNGELLLKASNERLCKEKRYYVFNFESGTMKKIGKTYEHYNTCHYVPSLLSLKDCNLEFRWR